MTSNKDKVAASVISAKSSLEQALEELEHLPAFDASTLGFAAHALNNYLTVIEGTVDLLSLSLVGHPDATVHTWLDSLRHATGLMTHTTHQLMGASTDGDPQLIFLKWDLTKFLQRGCDYYQRIAEKKQIQITLETEYESPYVWADPVAVAAAMDNLLSNAVKFSEYGKKVTVQLRQEPSHLVCSIRDEGPGLSIDDQTRLFQRGVQLSPVPTGGEPSTGYGLSVAKDLIVRVGGEIWCESKLGHGSAFFIRLPIYREDMHEPG